MCSSDLFPSHDIQQELSQFSHLQQHAKGHGIGLQLVQKLSHQLGWRVELYDHQYYTEHHPHLNLHVHTGLVVLVYINSNEGFKR